MNPPSRLRFAILPALLLLVPLALGPSTASADSGIAAAGPCAGEGVASLAGPIQKLLSPQDVAAGPGTVGGPGRLGGKPPTGPTPPSFKDRDACDMPGACDRGFVPASVPDPPTNGPTSNGPPVIQGH